MKRWWFLTALVLLSGCGDDGEPCRADLCVGLPDFMLGETQILAGAEVTTWFAEFVQRDVAENPLRLRLECTTDGDVRTCKKSFVMPDLPRLPTGQATLLTDNSSAQATEGSFRLTDVTPTSDGMSYRISGRVDVLRFQTLESTTQIDEGSFDLVSTP